MNWKIEFVEDEHYVRVTLEGVFSVEDHERMMEEIFSRPFWQPGIPILFDDRKLTHRETSNADLQKVSAETRANNERLGDSKLAFLTYSRSDFETLRRFELITEEEVSAWMHAFFDENEALRWLLAYRVRPSDGSAL